MKFLDEVTIMVASGNGGAGAVSFRREKFIEYGGPNGGNGGKGGDVVLVAVAALNTLVDYRFKTRFAAANGAAGGGRLCTGADGADLILEVPVGTEVLDATDDDQLLADFTKPGQTMRLLKGGDGGFGNTHYKSSTNRTPRQAGKGFPGKEMTITLRLKLIADAGLVGLPNAGKSTFLAATTAAKPKIADYPFTTLNPQLGVVRLPGHQAQELVLADIPGLIEGAHAGHGLGDKFLAHIERCRVLLHLIDATDDDIVGAYQTIRAELRAYGHGLARKPSLIALNKIDALTPAAIKAKSAALTKLTKKKIYLLSAATGKGTKELLSEVWRVVSRKGKASA